MRHSLVTRVLHALVAVAISQQLLTSWIMRMPRPASERSVIEILAFSAHQYLGLGSLLILIVFWLWTLIRRGEMEVGALLPWFSRRRCAALTADVAGHLRALLSFRIPAQTDQGALASAVHGLGLLTAMTMAVTGAAVYVGTSPDGQLTPFFATALEVHRVIANLMWAFLMGHAAMAIVHELKGRRLLTRMFAVGRASESG
jgi:cytochrome b561